MQSQLLGSLYSCRFPIPLTCCSSYEHGEFAQFEGNLLQNCLLDKLFLINSRLQTVVAHELAHILESDHTEAFWNEVGKVMPDYLERKDWLRMNGAGLEV